MLKTNAQKEKHKDYKKFVEKFEHKLTTDDCYTPPEVYDAILDWVVKEYGINKDNVVRPFYPNGDYEKFDYSVDKIVVDNPPFSILSEIKSFYCENNIKFFLFAPNLTLFSKNDRNDVCYIVANARIIYHNKANINTSFVTNLDDKYRIRVIPELKRKIEDSQNTETKSLPKYKYPKNVISAALLDKYLKLGFKIDFKNEEVFYLRMLESQKKYKKTIYGHGYLISDKKKEEMEKFMLEAEKERTIIWELSEKEKEIIKNLK